MSHALFQILVFPGFLFLSFFGMAAQFVDRKLYARFQNRIGPPWFQPLADLIKLFAKENIVPEEADAVFFKAMPILALASTVTAVVSIPIWSLSPIYSFEGDVVAVLYLLTIPTLTYFLGGWYSRSVYSMIGAARTIIQLFAYEVPLFLSVLAPAMLADTWSISGVARFYSEHPLLLLFNIPAFIVAITCLLGKLEKVPFDIPEAETEIVAGSFTEYSGWLFGFFRLSIDVEMVVGASLIAAVFLPFGFSLGPVAAFVLYVVKVLLVVELISLGRTIFARLRLDQMIEFCWKILAPIALLQVVVNSIVKGLIAQ